MSVASRPALTAALCNTCFVDPTARSVLWWLPLALALVAGCTSLDVPQTVSHAPATQRKAQAVQHWDVLADDVARRVTEKIAHWPAGEHPIHVAVVGDFGFGQGFRALLLTRLADRGVALALEPSTVLLKVDVQTVQHPSSGYVALVGTHVGQGVTVVRDRPLYNPGAADGDAEHAGVVLAAQAKQKWGTQRTEVLVTTSLESQGRYLARTADAYYIEPEDAVLYAPKEPAPLPAATPIKTWQVVAP